MGVDGSGTCCAQSVGQQASEHGAIQQRVTESARSIGQIANHPPGAVGHTDNIDRVVHQPARRCEPGRVRTEGGQRVEQRSGQHTVAYQLAFAGTVDEQCLQQAHALDRSVRQHSEFGSVDHEGQRVEPPGSALHPCRRRHAVTVSAALQREFVHQVAGAFGVEQTIGVALAIVQ